MGKQYVKCLTDGFVGTTKGKIYEVLLWDSEYGGEECFLINNDYGKDDYWWICKDEFELVEAPQQKRSSQRLTEYEQRYILDRPDDSSRSLAKQLWGTPKRKSSINDFRKRVKESDEELKGMLEEAGVPQGADEDFGEVSVKVKRVPERETSEDANQRILLISDLHIPYHHQDALEFLQHLKDKYNPTRVICMGDELDKHALSFHDSDPDLPSAGDELRQSLPIIQELHEMFPVMDILDSNHGSLVYRKSKHHGIPRHYIKSYREVLEVGDGWTWHYDMTLKLPTGNHFYLCHGKTADVTKLTQQMGMCAAQGHFHEKYKIEYWSTPVALTWGLQTGCLIDDSSYAFSYNNSNLKRPLIGTAVVIDGYPILEPLVMDEEGRWVGRKK